MLISLTIWNSECLSLAHIVKIRMNLLSFNFETEVCFPLCQESCSYIELMGNFFLIIWIAAMVHWHYWIWGIKTYSSPMKAVLGFALTSATFFDHLDFRLCPFGSHSRNQEEFTDIFIWSQKFIFLFFKKAAWILSSCEFSWLFWLQPWCTGSILFEKANSSPN